MKAFVLLVLFAVVVVLSWCTSKQFVVVNGEKIFVEIADEPVEMERGLMFREELCENCGMLFVFDESGKHAFWMKNTLIPLDIVFVDESGVVVDVLRAEPCKDEPCEVYRPEKDALYVLEVNAGFAELRNIREGTIVDFSFFKEEKT